MSINFDVHNYSSIIALVVEAIKTIVAHQNFKYFSSYVTRLKHEMTLSYVCAEQAFCNPYFANIP